MATKLSLKGKPMRFVWTPPHANLCFTECAEQNLLIHLIIIRSSLVIQTQLMDVLLSTEETGFLMLKNMRYVLVSHFISCIYLGPFA